MQRTALLLLILIFAANTWAVTPQQSSPNATDQDSAQQHHGTAKDSIVVQLNTSPQIDQQPSAEANEIHQQTDAIRKTVNVTWVLAIATFILAGIGGWQVLESRWANQRHLRAYVALKEEVKGRKLKAGKIVEFEPIIKNCGLTPAFDLSFKADVIVLPPAITDESLLPPLPDIATSSVGTMFPGNKAVISCRSDNPISKADIANFYFSRSGTTKTALYLYGSIYYSDAFTYRRQTDFCYEIQVNADGTIDGWHVSTVHNGST